MKILNKITLKNIFAKRNTITFISIVLSSMLLFSIALGFSTYRENNIKTIINTIGDQAGIYSNVELKNKTLFQNNKNIDKYYYLFKVKQVKYNEILFNLYGISDNFDYDIGLIGRLPNNDSEIVLKNDLNIKIDDIITLDSKEYKVVGLYSNSKINVHNLMITKTNEIDSRAIFIVYMKANKDVWPNLLVLRNNIELTTLNLRLEDQPQLDMNIEYLGQFTTSYGNGAYGQAIMILILMLFLLVFGFIVLFVIYNSFAISINERKKNYAIFKSIGTTQNQILKSVLFEAFMISLIAIPIGFILSLGLINGLIFVLNNILKDIILNPYTFEIYPIFILISLLFILVCIFIASFTPAKRASEANIINVIRQNTEINKSVKKNKLIRKLFGIECDIASKNSTRNFRKYNVTMFSITIGCILFLTVSIFLNVILYLEEKNIVYQPVSISIYGSTEQNNELVNKIIELPNVDKYLYQDYDNNIYNVSEEYVNDDFVLKKNINFISLIYIDDYNYQMIKKEFNITNDNPLITGIYHNEISENPYIVTYNDVPFFNTNNIKIDVYERNSEGKQGNYIKTIDKINVIDNYGKYMKENFNYEYTIYPVIVMPYSLKESQTKTSLNISLTCKDYMKCDKEIKSIIGDANYYNQQAENNKGYKIIDAIKVLIYLLIIIVLLITVMSIYNTININLSLRRREFAVLRSLGLTKKGFNKMILYESFMISIKSLIFGILLSFLIFALLIRILELGSSLYEIFLVMPKSIYLIPILSCITIVFLVVYISFILSSNKFKKDNIIDAIKEDIF